MMKLLDCAIIGGGPAGLNAALVLGRARRSVVLFDNNKARNSVTQESHGFITQDGASPSEFRERAHQDLVKYPSIQTQKFKIEKINKQSDGTFILETEQGDIWRARKILLATGLVDVLPEIDNIYEYYGKSLFSCPYCDGWELRDQPLIVIAVNEHAYHMATLLYNWSKDLLICTNGQAYLTAEQKTTLEGKGIRLTEQRIRALVGDHGMLAKVILESGQEELRAGGFVTPGWRQASRFADALGLKLNEIGAIQTDGLGRTSMDNVYAAGDSSTMPLTQLIIAAAEGSKAAVAINTDLTQQTFAIDQE